MSYQRYTNRNRNIYPNSMPFDSTLLFIVIFLLITGIMAVFSAAPKGTIASGQFGFVTKQFVCIITGFILMIIASKYDYKRIERFSIPFAWLVIGLLVMVLACGVTVNGAKRWIAVASMQFQPSEMAKLSVILLLATMFKENAEINFSKCFPYVLPILIMFGLIYKQPNLSMLIILSALCLQLFFIAGGSIKLILSAILAGCAGVFYSIQNSAYQKARIISWLNPDTDPLGQGYNIIQAIMAFVAGGFYGVGYGNSHQKLGWLPECHTDFIFPVFAEEFGFIGCMLIIGLFIAFMQRGLIIAKNCNNPFGRLLAAGITLVICTQAAINIAVTSAMIPATGVPLPFISYGGTSIIVTLVMVGILLNISRKRVRKSRSYERT